VSHPPERRNVHPHAAARRPACSPGGGLAAQLLLIALAVLCLAGCQLRSPTLDLWNVAIAGDRLQLVVTTTTEVTPYEGSSSSENQITYLVSAPLGPAGGGRPDLIADLSAGEPIAANRTRYAYAPDVVLGIASDRVVRIADTGEAVRDNLKVDLLVSPEPPAARGVLSTKWQVLRSWRTPYVVRGGRFVAPAPEVGLLDMSTLQPVAEPRLTKAIDSALASGSWGPVLTRNLSYVLVGDPSASGAERGGATAVNWRTGAKTKFRGDLGRNGVLLKLDEIGDVHDGEPGELWGLYENFDLPAYRTHYALIDARGRVRQSITVPSKLSPGPLGTHNAWWDAGRHVVLFFDAGPGSAQGGPVVVRIWDYMTGKTRDQYIDVAGAFRKAGSRYVPRE
jgi:hypothetical protein